MAFDGLDHRDPAMIYPASYHPGGHCTPIAVGEALRIAYAQARYQNRLAWHWALGWNFPSTTRTVTSAAAYTRLAGGRHVIPDEATHLVCAASFRFCVDWESTAFFRLVTDSGTSDDGAAVEIGSADRAELLEAHRAAFLSPFVEGPDTHRVLCGVELSNTSAGDLTATQLEGYATKDTGGAAVSIELLWAHCYWGIVDG